MIPGGAYSSYSFGMWLEMKGEIMTEEPGNYATRFKSKGIGVSHSHKPVSVMLPPDIDAYVHALPNRSEWLRQAIREKIQRDKQQMVEFSPE